MDLKKDFSKFADNNLQEASRNYQWLLSINEKPRAQNIYCSNIPKIYYNKFSKIINTNY